MAYDISSRDYLERALDCLSTGGARQLFYAAFELRCGVEARLQQYLEAWDHVSKERKRGWRMADLGRSAERAFQMGDRIMRWEVCEAGSSEPGLVLYYTPVTKALRRNVERIGTYLHAMQRHHEVEHPWWKEFRTLLNETAALLCVANTGTLLGPALTKRKGEMQMNVEALPGVSASHLIERTGGIGLQLVIKVTYLDQLPDPLETNAYVWRPKT